jgi:predicted lipoprotein with Yx(FWY)xxD motif
VTLNGLPLYYFAKDTKAGDILGQGVNDVWYLADPSGEMIRMGSSGY